MTGRGRPVILVVEDDDSMREAIETLLGAAGFSTMPYGSAEALLAEKAIGLPLCIISDLKLPAMSGLDLLIELRRRGRQEPVILITAYDTMSTRREAQRRGAAAYLTKPFPGAELLTAIHNVSPGARPQ
jgi:FixJ family two-component response regulator